MDQVFVPFVKDKSDIPASFKHPIFQVFGYRKVIADHSYAEEKILQKWAKDCQTLVEIGVAEGASARALREAIASTSTLYLIDPYLPGRIPVINFTKIVAHRHVNRCQNATVFWLQQFSYDAIKDWNKPINFLFIDGDHSYEGCMQDWQDWSPFVTSGGIVAFHDARLFENGWTQPDWGSVRVVNELFRETSSDQWQIVDEVDSLVVVQKL
ncbi:MAG TPA: class I SAM-dependent methyltransferase [Cyanophyceae cyanobacterium]